MNKKELINFERITKYLMVNASSSAPLSASEIISMTGVSRASFYRHVKHPAIKRVELFGGKVGFYLDPEELIKAPSREKEKMVPVVKSTPEWLHMVMGYTPEEWVKVMATFNHEADKKRFLAMMNQSINFQEGLDSISVETAQQGRIAVNNLMQYCVTMIAYLRMVQQHPEYMSDENWWAIWPKD